MVTGRMSGTEFQSRKRASRTGRGLIDIDVVAPIVSGGNGREDVQRIRVTPGTHIDRGRRGNGSTRGNRPRGHCGTPRKPRVAGRAGGVGKGNIPAHLAGTTADGDSPIGTDIPVVRRRIGGSRSGRHAVRGAGAVIETGGGVIAVGARGSVHRHVADAKHRIGEVGKIDRSNHAIDDHGGIGRSRAEIGIPASCRGNFPDLKRPHVHRRIEVVIHGVVVHQLGGHREVAGVTGCRREGLVVESIGRIGNHRGDRIIAAAGSRECDRRPTPLHPWSD